MGGRDAVVRVALQRPVSAETQELRPEAGPLASLRAGGPGRDTAVVSVLGSPVPASCPPDVCPPPLLLQGALPPSPPASPASVRASPPPCCP